jgi:hypothetical protein
MAQEQDSRIVTDLMVLQEMVNGEAKVQKITLTGVLLLYLAQLKMILNAGTNGLVLN